MSRSLGLYSSRPQRATSLRFLSHAWADTCVSVRSQGSLNVVCNTNAQTDSDSSRRKNRTFGLISRHHNAVTMPSLCHQSNRTLRPSCLSCIWFNSAAWKETSWKIRSLWILPKGDIVENTNLTMNACQESPAAAVPLLPTILWLPWEIWKETEQFLSFTAPKQRKKQLDTADDSNQATCCTPGSPRLPWCDVEWPRHSMRSGWQKEPRRSHQLSAPAMEHAIPCCATLVAINHTRSSLIQSDHPFFSISHTSPCFSTLTHAAVSL